jgi:hypothetical protein
MVQVLPADFVEHVLVVHGILPLSFSRGSLREGADNKVSVLIDGEGIVSVFVEFEQGSEHLLFLSGDVRSKGHLDSLSLCEVDLVGDEAHLRSGVDLSSEAGEDQRGKDSGHIFVN